MIALFYGILLMFSRRHVVESDCFHCWFQIELCNQYKISGKVKVLGFYIQSVSE